MPFHDSETRTQASVSPNTQYDHFSFWTDLELTEYLYPRDKTLLCFLANLNQSTAGAWALLRFKSPWVRLDGTKIFGWLCLVLDSNTLKDKVCCWTRKARRVSLLSSFQYTYLHFQCSVCNSFATYWSSHSKQSWINFKSKTVHVISAVYDAWPPALFWCEGSKFHLW